MAERTGLPPVVDSNSRALVLGSLPGETSIQARQYYRHGTNRFWKVVYEAFGAAYNRNLSYIEKTAFLKVHGIALWNMYQSVTISNPIINDFEGFLTQYPSIKCVLFNGKQLADFYNQVRSPDMLKVKEIFKRHGIITVTTRFNERDDAQFRPPP